MECMVAENCPEESGFRDDGTVIPDWAHLALSRSEMADLLRGRLLPGTCSYILEFLYDSPHLNRQPWSVINSGFYSCFPFVRMNTRGYSDVNSAEMPADGLEDYSIYGFDAVCRKRRQSRLHEKCCRLMRRAGL